MSGGLAIAAIVCTLLPMASIACSLRAISLVRRDRAT